MSFFENLTNSFNRYLVPALITLIGILILWYGITPDEKTGDKQNTWFMLGGFALTTTGLLSLLYIADIITKPINLILTFGVMPITIAVFGYYNYRSVKEDLEFTEKKEMIKTEVKQRLIDIRDAQVEFRLVYSRYAKDMNELKTFIRDGKAMNITKEGSIPDYIRDEWVDSLRAWDPEKYKDRPEKLTEAEGVRLGIIKRDTTYEPVINKIFLNEKKASKRISRYGFSIDSLDIAPFTGGKKKIVFKTGTVNRNGADLPVFEAKWYLQNSRLNPDKFDTLKVGSMKEPTTNGNWDE
jgi:LPXTG-motif cell wall-anchored protein